MLYKRSSLTPLLLNEDWIQATASVPLDPFDGQELRYKKLERGFVIYSIGEDQKDNGGKEPPKSRQKNINSDSDITFIIEK